MVTIRKSALPGIMAVTLAAFGMAGQAAVQKAEAAVLSSVGDSVSVSWLLEDGESDPQGNENTLGQDISATAIFELTMFDEPNDKVELRVTVENTTADQGNEVGVQKIGVGVDPTLDSVTGPTDDSSTDDDKFTSAVKCDSCSSASELPNSAMIDLLAETDTGAPNILREGEEDIFLLVLMFEPDALTEDGVTLTPFDAKIQTINPSFELTADEFPGGGGGGDLLPVPGSLALFVPGLIGLWWFARRRVQ